MMVPALLQAMSLAAASPPAVAPAIFWNSEGHRSDTTVLALGGNLAGSVIELCFVDPSLRAPATCVTPTVVGLADASVQFVVPAASSRSANVGDSAGAGPARAMRFRACRAR